MTAHVHLGEQKLFRVGDKLPYTVAPGCTPAVENKLMHFQASQDTCDGKIIQYIGAKIIFTGTNLHPTLLVSDT